MLELLKALDSHPGIYGVIVSAMTVLVQLHTRAAVLRLYRAVSREFVRREEFDHLSDRVDAIVTKARTQHA